MIDNLAEPYDIAGILVYRRKTRNVSLCSFINLLSLIIFKLLQLVNREMFWVVTEVCSEHNLVRRSKIIKQFIKVASKLNRESIEGQNC